MTTSLRLDTDGKPDVRLVALISGTVPQDLVSFDREDLRKNEKELRLALLDRELEPGFAAGRLLAARDHACTILCTGCECATAPTVTESPEWIEIVKSLDGIADIIDRLRRRQTFFRALIFAAEAGIADGVADIKRYLFNKSLAKNAPRLVVDLAGIGFVKAVEPSAAQVMAFRRVLAVLPDDARARLNYDIDISNQVWADIRAFIMATLPCGDPLSALACLGIASFRADKIKEKVERLAVYDDEGLTSKLSMFTHFYDAWFKLQQATQQANADLAKEAKIAKEEREIRILESFGLRETADAEERLEALLAHINNNLDHYRFAILNQRAGAINSDLIAFARSGAVDPTPVGVVGNKLAVPVRLYPATKLRTYFEESIADLRGRIEVDESCHILPTPALYSEAIVGQCNGCEEYVEKSRSLDLRQRAAIAEQAEQEAERYAARLKATPAILDNPNPSTESVSVRLESVEKNQAT